MKSIFLREVLELRKQDWAESVNPLVTISCTTFNHHKYIKTCIESFLSQKTSFPVEILIHDDASTDGTAEIVKDYQERYPKIIRATLQKENKFSKGEMVNSINFRVARGDYIALCHGDDYWIDDKKLQFQVQMMAEHKVGISGHPAEIINVDGDFLGRRAGFEPVKTVHSSARDLINRNGNMLPFGSIVIDKDVKMDLIKFMPPVQFHTGIQMLGALRSGLLVLPNLMSAYRIEVPGSTTELLLNNRRSAVETTFKRIASIKSLRGLYHPRFSKEFDGLLARQALLIGGGVTIRDRASVLARVCKDESSGQAVVLVCMFVYEMFVAGIQKIARTLNSDNVLRIIRRLALRARGG